jgi:hypothetical protein
MVTYDPIKSLMGFFYVVLFFITVLIFAHVLLSGGASLASYPYGDLCEEKGYEYTYFSSGTCADGYLACARNPSLGDKYDPKEKRVPQKEVHCIKKPARDGR